MLPPPDAALVPDAEVGRIIIKERHLRHITVSSEVIDEFELLFTPEDALSKKEFDLPEMIIPEKFTNFNSLILHREKIRNLKLLPIKASGPHEYYNSLSRDDLAEQLLEELGDDKLMLAANAYPYSLPPDLVQYILWTKDVSLSRREAAEFIARASMGIFGRGPEDVIIFERPLNTDSKLVRGSFKPLRHLHFWTSI